MTEESPPRVVFDCGVFLQGLISESGPAVACLELFERGEITLLFSEATLLEIKDVLSRSKLRAKYPLLTEERTTQLLESLWSKAEFVQNVPQHFSYERDPDDEPYLNLAIEAEAAYLVSRDKDLLDLMTGYTEECKEFRRRFRPLKIVDPVTFLQETKKDDP
ncbi:MAG: putative toxin-antitoxin system toxin component, PIN family [Acidobacteriota bacterium]